MRRSKVQKRKARNRYPAKDSELRLEAMLDNQNVMEIVSNHFTMHTYDSAQQAINTQLLSIPSITSIARMKKAPIERQAFPHHEPFVIQSQSIKSHHATIKHNEFTDGMGERTSAGKPQQSYTFVDHSKNITSPTYDNAQNTLHTISKNTASYNYSNHCKTTNIAMAMHLGNADIIRSIAHKKPRALLQSGFGKLNDNIFHLAARRNNLTALKIVLSLLGESRKNQLMKSNNKNNVTPIQVAAGCSGVAFIQLLISNGALLNCKSKEGYNLLHIACIHENEAVVRFLAQNYQWMLHEEYKDLNGTPIFTTFYNRSVHCFNAIIESGFNISNITYKPKEYTLMHFCCALGNTLHLPLLVKQFCNELQALNYSAFLMSKDTDGRTPLDLACIKTDKDFILTLLNLLPLGTVTVKHLRSAISYARVSSNEDVIPTLTAEIAKLEANQEKYR